MSLYDVVDTSGITCCRICFIDEKTEAQEKVWLREGIYKNSAIVTQRTWSPEAHVSSVLLGCVWCNTAVVETIREISVN